MDQKNTIVKCTANPNCLFNHNGICDNYVITIGADGSCQEYVETEDVIIRPVFCEHCGHYEDHGLLQNPCNKHECYRHRKDNACLDFIYSRGQRAKGNFYEDTCDDKVTVRIKVAELNKPNKNQSVISDWDFAAIPDICKTCKKVVYGQRCEYKNVANGVWACYEIDETIKKAGTLNECWWCDFFNSENRKCKHKDPDIDKFGCHSSQSTGGNR